MKTSELIGPALDWAVATCEGLDYWHPDMGPSRPEYSTDWSQGGPIIEREKISTEYPRDDLWVASIWMGNSKRPTVRHGPTPLIAAMRCYVASKIGDEVDVPEEVK